MVPEYGEGYKSKIVLPNLIDADRYAIFSIVVQSPTGETKKVRLSLDAYLGIVAATNCDLRARVVEQPANQHEAWLVETVRRLAAKAGIGMPEVAIYDGAPNAFATGAFRNSALVAVSTGLLQSMNKEEVEAVLGHEIAHVTNGDMVTLTLIQGVVNTFVIFLSRIIGYVVDRVILKNERGQGIGFFVTVMASQILLGVFASMIVAWFSRQREFRADAASAGLLGSPQPMVNALSRLAGVQAGALPQAMAASGISSAPAASDNRLAAGPTSSRVPARAPPRSARRLTARISIASSNSSRAVRNVCWGRWSGR